jgi:hypothetical protein
VTNTVASEFRILREALMPAKVGAVVEESAVAGALTSSTPS